MTYETFAPEAPGVIFVDPDVEADVYEIGLKQTIVESFPKPRFEQPRDPTANWRDKAACAGRQVTKLLCADCLVSDECRDWAIASREKHGIWGGMNFTERNVYKKTQDQIIENKRQAELMLRLETIIVPVGSTSLLTAPRNELLELLAQAS